MNRLTIIEGGTSALNLLQYVGCFCSPDERLGMAVMSVDVVANRAQKDRVPAYASMIQLSTPEERPRMAVHLMSVGWTDITRWHTKPEKAHALSVRSPVHNRTAA